MGNSSKTSDYQKASDFYADVNICLLELAHYITISHLHISLTHIQTDDGSRDDVGVPITRQILTVLNYRNIKGV